MSHPLLSIATDEEAAAAIATVGHRFVLPFAPPMPTDFFGAVRYEFQGGKLISAVVEERLKP